MLPIIGMIYGIGTDVCDIRRIRAAWLRRGDRFASHILSDREMGVFHERLGRVESRGMAYLATRFSAKEAFSKAIGLGLHAPMRWRDCAILNARSGRPELALHGDLAAWFESRHLRGHVTLSDEKEHVVSFVVVEVTG